MKAVEVIESTITKDNPISPEASKESVKTTKESTSISQESTEDNMKKESAILNQKSQKAQRIQETQKVQSSSGNGVKTEAKQLVRTDTGTPTTGAESQMPLYVMGTSALIFMLVTVSIMYKRMKLGVNNGK